MKLTTGKISVPIEFDNGERSEFFFNPNDKNLQAKIDAFSENVEKKMHEIDMEKYRLRYNNDVAIDLTDIDAVIDLGENDFNNMKKNIDVISDMTEEYSKIVKEELNAVFENNISEIVFKYCQPFDTISYIDEKGKERQDLYVLYFLRTFAIELRDYYDRNNKAVEKHLSKYRRK